MNQFLLDNGLVTIILAAISVPLFIFFIIARLQHKKAKNRLQEKIKETERFQSELEDSNAITSSLKEKYGSIIDAEKYASELKVNAASESEKSNTESAALIVDANKKVDQATAQSSEIIEKAHDRSSFIIEVAEQEARDIAGSAYEAKEKADTYKAAITAMKNTIAGYNDEYIIPNHSVLDDLADDYSFSEAGAELKAARKLVRDLVKNGNAGSCDYVEKHRNTFAINFVVDAFNGKTASALSKVKHDNFGKISQEITDAFALVNHNGEPFKNARIKKEYLKARQQELKWAVTTHELRQKELAEQKEIKQQIREEEKARREMEKAIKESEKEEKLIQTALVKVRKELESAGEDQRITFENELKELKEKLATAEAKGERALSMAQQTRRGHVYIISNIGSFGDNVFKIGMTRRLEPLDRVKELGDASVPFSFDVHAMLYSEDAPTLEKTLHRKFEYDAVNKVNPRKEFFRTTIAEIKQAVLQQNISNIHWTLKADATEYRESLALDKTQHQETA